MYSIAYKWTPLTGGADGLSGIMRPWSLSDTGFYFLVLSLFTILLFLFYRTVQSRFGLVLKGIRENEARMRSLGYNVWAYKLFCYILSGIFSAVAGAIYVYYNGYVGTSELSIGISGVALLICIIGGRGIFIGPIIGAVIMVILADFLSKYTEYWLFFLGIIFVIVVRIAPKGIGGYILDYFSRISKRRTESNQNA
jgi:branched-chain amino acid transport system permease protein